MKPYREPRPTSAGDPYNYASKDDAAANEFFAKAAKKEGISVSGWMAANGMVGAALEARVKKNERPESTVPDRLLQGAETDRSLQAFADAIPGGVVIPSIIDHGRVSFRKDMPKRRRGRPVKNFVAQQGDEDDAGS